MHRCEHEPSMSEDMALEVSPPPQRSSPFKRPRRSTHRREESGDGAGSIQSPAARRHRRTNTVPSFNTLLSQEPSPPAILLLRKSWHLVNPYLGWESEHNAGIPRHRTLSVTQSRYRTDFNEIKLVGRGSFSEVFMCRHTVDNRLYAIKRLTRQGQDKMLSLSSRNSQEAALQEVFALCSQAQHPNLVSYHDAWMEDGDLLIQLEYCGSTLLARVDPQNRVCEAELSLIAFQLSLALDWLHSRSVVHRDVKPENSFEMPSGVFKLGDLGCAAQVTEAHPHSNGASQGEDRDGDPRYLSREALKLPIASDSCKVDMFALGASLLELAQATRLPSGGEVWHRIRDQGGEACRSLGLGPLISQSISDLLHPDPARRPTAGQVCARLGELAGKVQDEAIASQRARVQRKMGELDEREKEQSGRLKNHQKIQRQYHGRLDPAILNQLQEQARRNVEQQGNANVTRAQH
eukprot:TRINITY_DN5052_c0_g1_i3.p1 TRINITY_DN5052_c0_g1~~TRINITY_DN5052_c0_g1_i3.p1  ORF type:complete len:463 (-),score=67.37 TRINITY_DN5052_c0_g1_i3:52-1440(-)